jgi:hypothetical protein
MLISSLNLEEWTAMAMGHVARSWYCGWVPPVGQEIIRESIHPELIQKLRELQDSLEVLSRICDQAVKTATNLRFKSSNLKSHIVMGVRDREELQTLGQTLLDLEDLVDRLAKTHPPILAFSQMSKVLMHHLKGTDLSELGKETAQSYRHIHDGVQVMREWIKYTLELAKPVAIQSSNVTVLSTIHKSKDKELSP